MLAHRSETLEARDMVALKGEAHEHMPFLHCVVAYRALPCMYIGEVRIMKEQCLLNNL